MRDAALAVSATVAIPRGELDVRTSRAGGPGGQHVNTSSTRVEVRWAPARSAALDDAQRGRVVAALAGRLDAEGRLRVVAADTRSQRQNRALAEERLAALVRRALIVPTARRASEPGRAAREARLAEKRHQRDRKRDRRWRAGDD